MSVFQELLLHLFTKVVIWRSTDSLMFNRLILDASEAAFIGFLLVHKLIIHSVGS
jgi:hypothetical protein